MSKPESFRTGTCHYASRHALQRAYGADYVEALKEGRVFIGKPEVPEGCKLRIDIAGRYWIVGPASGSAPAP